MSLTTPIHIDTSQMQKAVVELARAIASISKITLALAVESHECRDAAYQDEMRRS